MDEQASNPAPNRRWFRFQFGLLDMFMTTTAIAIPLIARAYGELATSLLFAPMWLPVLFLAREVLLKRLSLAAALSFLVVIELAAFPLCYFAIFVVPLKF